MNFWPPALFGWKKRITPAIQTPPVYSIFHYVPSSQLSPNNLGYELSFTVCRCCNGALTWIISLACVHPVPLVFQNIWVEVAQSFAKTPLAIKWLKVGFIQRMRLAASLMKSTWLKCNLYFSWVGVIKGVGSLQEYDLGLAGHCHFKHLYECKPAQWC